MRTPQKQRFAHGADAARRCIDQREAQRLRIEAHAREVPRNATVWSDDDERERVCVVVRLRIERVVHACRLRDPRDIAGVSGQELEWYLWIHRAISRQLERCVFGALTRVYAHADHTIVL